MSDRETIFARIRAAAADVPPGEPSTWNPATDPDPQAAYIRLSDQTEGQIRDAFVENCREYRANVTVCSGGEDAVREAIEAICARRGAAALAAPSDLPRQWTPQGITVRADDPPLSVAELDDCDGVLSGCAVAIASTGTIVLDAGAAQGRRVLSLIPDLHICVVRADQIRGGVPEAIGELRAAAAAGAPLTLISGPSATSDIELRRVEGVHGPRQLEVIVTDGS